MPLGGLLLLLLLLLLQGGSGNSSRRRSCVGSGEVVHRCQSGSRAGPQPRPVGEQERGSRRLLLAACQRWWWLHHSLLLLLLLQELLHECSHQSCRRLLLQGKAADPVLQELLWLHKLLLRRKAAGPAGHS